MNFINIGIIVDNEKYIVSMETPFNIELFLHFAKSNINSFEMLIKLYSNDLNIIFNKYEHRTPLIYLIWSTPWYSTYAENNVIKLSHCILPTRMSGFEKKPLPYTLRDYHGSTGVTAFTEIPTGAEVTLARVQRNLERIVALSGEIMACEDTTFCRNTVTIRIQNTREFIKQAEGNHHALVFGNYLNDLEDLSGVLECKFHSIF